MIIWIEKLTKLYKQVVHKNFKKGKRLQTAKRLLGEGLVTSEVRSMIVREK